MIRTLSASLLLLAATGCQKPAPQAAAPVADADSSAATRWVRPAPAEGVALFESPARVTSGPESQAAVGAPLPARVLEVRVQPGQTVAAGEVLAEVLMPEVVQAAGQLTAAGIRLETAARRKAQLDALKAEGLARSAELGEVEARLADARADAQSARATLRAAGVSDAQARALLEGSGSIPLKSPIAGMVTAVDARLGETRAPEGGPLFEIAGTGASRVEARLTLAPPPEAGFELVLPDGRRTALQLEALSPRVDPNDGTRQAWLLPEGDGALPPPGASVRVRVRPPTSWRSVPARAVTMTPAGPTVVVRENGAVRAQVVKVLAASGAEVVVDGLGAAPEVAADAAQAMPSGDQS